EIPDGTEPPLLKKMIVTSGATYNSVQFTPDGKTVLTGAFQNTPRGMERLDQVWDLTNGVQKATLKGLDARYGYARLRLSPDGCLALIGTNRTAEVIDWKADRRVRLVKAGVADFTSVLFAPD